MIVVDTTILVYAVGAEHEHAEPSRRLFDAVAAGRVAATTTVEVIQEFAHVYARRRERAEAVRHARRYATVLSPLLVSSEASVHAGLRLFARYPGLSAFDALLAAVALANESTAFVSADSGFSGVSGLNHVSPGSLAFDRLLPVP